MKSIRQTVFAFSALVMTFAPGCVTDPATVAPVVPVPSAKGVYIVNEGNFGRGNASLSYYDLETFRLYNDVFGAVNGKVLGDVAQGMVIRNGAGYIVVNNSARIEIVSVATNVSLGTIPTGSGTSPWQIVFVNDSIALVSDFYGNQVLVVNTTSRTVTGSIPVGPNPQGIALANGKAYVANNGFGSGKTVSVILLSSMTSLTTITVGDSPSSLVVTPGGVVDVLCGGSYGDYADPNDDTPAKITVIDPASDAIVGTMLIGGHATTMAVGSDGIGYVPSTDEVLRIDTRINAVSGTFVKGFYYGIGVEIVSGDVYLSDPKTYIQPGTVSVYSSDGRLRVQFDAGLIPGSFTFKR
jgi:hypothetical protein